MTYLNPEKRALSAFLNPGLFWLIIATISAIIFYWEGLEALLVAWQLPEYSHGPLIPILSAFLFLRQLKEVPVQYGEVPDRTPGLWLLAFSLVFALMGKLSKIDDIVAYALILWVGAVLLISFGWRVGKHFWPPVLHLVYMLPLPGVFYYKLSTWLQKVSSEFGVWLLQQINVPVYLEGNIIDLGALKLHVAEACSGLNYLFPILSFSYIFAVLYRGPMWHKAVLLLAAAPITVAMNSVRIAIAGWIAQNWGVEHLEGFTHFFEGWVIFMICIILLFMLAWIMLRFHPDRPSLPNALDLDTSGLGTQAMRLTLVQPSRALIICALVTVGSVAAWHAKPDVAQVDVARDPFAIFPRTLGEWKSSPNIPLDESVEVVLGADDYHSVQLVSATAAAPVGMFMAWYDDQADGGTHSPEVCLPGAGWEIAWLERVDISEEFGLSEEFELNRAVIQKGQTRMVGYYWFEQQGRHIAWDFEAKFWLLWNGVTKGRTDGALVRLLTTVQPDETEKEAEARLKSVFLEMNSVLPRFIPD
ncbi:VPLPA-CTERM-specific exosortase XrtD [uncultured Tateyamaria sp.]|uniref:VPLPA-CTERM-specific exosortase XrtD n=1 Tax=uncultured Tateyamaria sp. TaxID=455651 RepID=UPI00262EB7BA|nr:VPLPA-CTERM-specific exosortase XrtD [uncultured Tateyamaria sp.]